MEQSSFLTTVLIVVAFTLGVLGSNLFRSVFGLLARLNYRESLSDNTKKPAEKLPDLPPTVRLSTFSSALLMDYNRFQSHLQRKILATFYYLRIDMQICVSGS